MLAKQNENRTLIGAWIGIGACLLVMLFIVTFIFPGFYTQYQRAKHSEITDVTADERTIIEQNLDFTLPQTAQIQKISAPSALMEPTFYMLFSMPVGEKDGFVQSISKLYLKENIRDGDQFEITVNGDKYFPINCYDNVTQNFNCIYEYETIGQRAYFYLVYTDYPQEIGDIFYERIRIMPKWLDFH